MMLKTSQPMPDESVEEIEEVDKTIYPKKTRKIASVEDRYWDFFQSMRKHYGLTWNETFHRFAVYGNGIAYIFEAPPVITKHYQLDINTVIALTDTWVDNMRLNFPHIDQSNSVEILRKYGHYAGKPAIVIAAGPSLLEHDHLERLARADFPGPIISTTHSLKWCYEKGVIPEMTAIVDGDREKMVKFLEDPLVDQYAPETKLVANTGAANNAIEKWSGQRYFFQSPIPSNIVPNVDRVLWALFPYLPLLDTGGNCGAFCTIFAAYLGCNPIITLGLDYAYPEGFPYDQTQYYGAWMRSVGEGLPYPELADMHKKIFKHGTHPYFKTKYYTDFVYRIFLKNFRESMRAYSKAMGFEIINATEGGAVFDEGIKCMKFKDALEKYARGEK